MKYAPNCGYSSTMMIEVFTYTKLHGVIISQKTELSNIFLPVYSLMLVCLYLFCSIMCSISCRGYEEMVIKELSRKAVIKVMSSCNNWEKLWKICAWTVSVPAEIGLPISVVCLADVLESVVSDVENAPLPYCLILSTQNIYVVWVNVSEFS
jgi:hypothetical protein